MRIIGGQHKGRRLQAPKGLPARPTTDYAREALFSILHAKIDWPTTNVLDLFAGLGGLGLESLSRGANSLESVEQHGKTVRWLHQVKTQLSLESWQIHRAEVMRYLQRSSVCYDLVFADPPYEYPNYDALISEVLKNHLEPDGQLVLEHRQSTSFASHRNLVAERTYGEVRFSFFENNTP